MEKKKMSMNEVMALSAGIELMIQAGVDFSVDLGFDLAVTKGNCATHVAAFNQQRNTILKKHGKTNGVEGQFTIAPENMEEYAKDAKSLDEKMVSVNVTEMKIKKSDLGDAKLPLEFFVQFKPFMEV